jgi:GalNAc-alpha-(1->4)-GalNAc-alpha-(1->3)-diNAcBac-PP-undecaprenol alpha-1,4-N-acetyl-D-galactosaminyltransferase
MSAALAGRRITFVSASLGGGGAERNLLRLAAHLRDEGAQVSVVTLMGAESDDYAVPAGIARRAIGRDRMGGLRWYRIAARRAQLNRLRDEILATRPELVISFIDQTNVEVLLALRSHPVPVIVAERVNPAAHRLRLAWRVLRRLVYPRAARVTVLTEDSEHWARGLWPRWRVARIPNPVPFHAVAAGVREGAPYLCAMGRLASQKGFDLLIDAFARIADRHPALELRILGEGPARAALEAQARDRGLAARVHLPGRLDDPFPVVAAAEVFVLSSRYEGFPMALAEAMALGVASISFDCPGASRELIRDGVDGILVPPADVAALAAAIDRMLGDPVERQRLAAAATEVRERFSAEAVLARWTALVGATLAEARS